MKRQIWLAPLLLLISVFAFAKKDAGIESRKEFLNDYQKVLEQRDWPAPVLLKGKNKDVLQIWLINAAVARVYEFEKEFVEPVKGEAKNVGFVTIEIKMDTRSASFPDGVWDIPLN